MGNFFILLLSAAFLVILGQGLFFILVLFLVILDFGNLGQVLVILFLFLGGGGGNGSWPDGI